MHTSLEMVRMTPMETEIIIKLLAAAALGALIGLEREFNRSAAGIKTYSIVCMGSALFTLAAFYTTITIAAGVITGIGFLGAAMIFKSKNKVTGLTTAALIWATAAIGFAVGIGFYFAAASAAALLMIILIPVEYVEKKYVEKKVLEMRSE